MYSFLHSCNHKISCLTVVRHVSNSSNHSEVGEAFKSISNLILLTWNYMRRLPILSSSASHLHARCGIPAKIGNTRQNHQNAIIQGKRCTLLINPLILLVNHLSDFTVTLQHFTTRHIKIHHAFNSLRVSTRTNN